MPLSRPTCLHRARVVALALSDLALRASFRRIQDARYRDEIVTHAARCIQVFARYRFHRRIRGLLRENRSKFVRLVVAWRVHNKRKVGLD